MSEQAEKALEWWEHFATKIQGGLPTVGSALLGRRFKLQEQMPDGSWVDTEPPPR